MDTQTIKTKTTTAAEWRQQTRHISPLSVGTDASFTIAGLIRDLGSAETQICKLKEKLAAMPNDPS